jgi:hypothetical protein
MDGHHPNLEGHILLAKCFAKEMEKLLGDKIIRNNITAEEILNHFDFRPDDMLYAYRTRAEWLCDMVLPVPVQEREENLLRAVYYLEKAKEIQETPAVFYGEFIIAATGGDKEKAMYCLEKGKLLTENRLFFYNECKIRKNTHLALFKDILPENILNKIIGTVPNADNK